MKWIAPVGTVLLLISSLGGKCWAAIPRKEIVEGINTQYTRLQDSKAWMDFAAENSNYFPNPEKDSNLVVNVVKEDFEYKSDVYAIGTSYRQSVVNASPTKVKTLLSRPDVFQELYGLDKPTAPDATLQAGDALPATFDAHIYKKLPAVLPDQDYTMRYTSKQDGEKWYQRVTLVEDKGDFALRETLIVVEPYKGKTIFREIGKVYPLQWAMRALGPQIRLITRSELTKISKSFQCAAESPEPISKQLAKDCWNKSK